MKKSILLLLAICAVLMGGCQRNSDAAKVDALTQKIDVLLQEQSMVRSNQVWIIRELGSVERQVVELPTMRQIDSTAYYYHTNAISTIQGQIDAEAHAMLGMSSLLMNEDGLILTNIFTLETLNPGASQPTASESLADTARRLQMEDDISQMNVKIDNIQDDLRNIKTRLGILY